MHVLVEVAAAQQGLVTAAQLRSAGIRGASLTRAVRAGALVRVRPAVYGASPLPPVPRQVVVDDLPAEVFVQHVRAVLLSLGRLAAASGRTAAALRGWGLLVEPRVLDVVVPHGRSRSALAGVRVRQVRSTTYNGVALADLAALRVTSAVDTVVACALELPLLEAVVVADSALRSGQVELAALRAVVGRLPGTRDARQLRKVLDLADPLSGSVLESVMRVRLVLAGVTGFRTQVALSSLGTHVLRVDFCFDVARLVVETDGARFHDAALDRLVDNRLAVAGWRVLRFTWAQVVHDGEAVIEQVVTALAVHEDVHLPVRTSSRTAA